MISEAAIMTVKISIIFEGLASLLSSPCCFKDLLFRLGLQLFGSLLSLVFFYLLGCELVDVAIGQSMLADGSEEELVGFEEAAIFDDVLFGFGLRGRGLQVLCVLGIN